MDDPRPGGSQRFILLLVVAAVALTVVLLSPFWGAFFLAAVLAAAFRPWTDWLSAHLGGRRTIAAALITVGVLLALVLPLAGLGTLLVKEALDGITWVRHALASEGIGGLAARLPAPLHAAAQRLIDAVPNPQEHVRQLAGAQGGQAAAAVGGIVGATAGAVFQALMMLIALFFFLLDGRRLVAWVGEALPLEERQYRELVGDFRKTAVAVLVTTLATAGIQTATAVVGYLVARAPNPIFLAAVTFVIALIPALGGTAAVLAVAALQLATGHTVSGIFLLAWALLAVALVDNLVRPLLLKSDMEMHGGIVFFALLGGVAVFGGIGILVGPLIVTFLIAVLRLWRRDYGRRARTERRPAPTSA